MKSFNIAQAKVARNQLECEEWLDVVRFHVLSF